MDMETFKHINDECVALRARLCGEIDQTPEAMLAVASCMLQQVQVIHEAIGGPKLNAALLYAAADQSAA